MWDCRKKNYSIRATGKRNERKMIWAKKEEDYGVIRKVIREDETNEKKF